MTCNKFVLTLFVIFLSLNSIKVFAEIDYTKLSADEYKKYRTPDCEENAIYIIKANAPINTEAHANA